MKNNFRFTFAFLFFASLAFSQNRVTDIGLEFQVYPTGIIPGFRIEKSVNKYDVANARVGYQIINHRDQGLHDDEKGSGYGLSLGYKHYFEKYFSGINLGIRTDVWFNSIDWKTTTDTGTLKGKSDIIVLQPTLELGWAFLLGDNMVLTPAIAAGFEKNIKTKGEKTGEGLILLAGITAAYRMD
ncbi:MAG: hypothetical protein IT258_06775 [Saprospiraceae bacterium]|nr:hypothetical protein [Saprospiraceae bacterium]